MKTKDITLSSSLIAIYLVTQFLGSAIPIKISAFMISALFALFWHYLPFRINLTIVLFRFGMNVIGSIKYIPKLFGYLRIESIIGLEFSAWAYGKNISEISDLGVDLLSITAQARPTTIFYLLIYTYMLCFALITPYLFYRYFRWKGLFRRLPKF